MADFLRTLNSPELVAKFQRFCGIQLVESENGSCDKVNKHSHRGTPNGTKPSDIPNGDCHQIPQPNSNKNEQTNGDLGHARQRLHENGRIIPENAKTGSSSSDQSSSKEATKEYVIKYKPFLYFMQFGASCGNEIFYVIFFPWWFWNIDGYVGRRVCLFWCIFMYIGQAAKDVIRWPRPASPPVVRMEKRYSLEYGMPSTHAMVGGGMPFSILLLTINRYEYEWTWGLVACIVWCTMVCVSRVYLGMHTVLDVIVGLVSVTVLGVIIFPFLDTFDHFLLTHRFAPAVCMLLPIALALCYPTLDRWSTARGDTTTVLAINGGVNLGHWVSYQYGFMQRAVTPPPYQVIYPTWEWFGMMLIRLFVGVAILFITKLIVKSASYNIACRVFGACKKDGKAHQRLPVELSYKFCTYSSMAFNTVYLVPLVFRYLGIERETFFTEI